MIVTTTPVAISGGEQSAFGTQKYFSAASATVLSANADCLPLEVTAGVVGSLLWGNFMILISRRNLNQLNQFVHSQILLETNLQ